MARWRLQAAHYLFTNPPTEWEQKETSRETGRQHVVRYKVPRLLEPKDPADWTEGEDIVVCDGSNPQRKDVIFLGEPTPDMEPVDDEAKAITKKFIDSGRWKKPTDGEVYGEGLIKQFMAEIQKVNIQQPPPAVSFGVDPKAFAELQAQVKALIAENVKLKEAKPVAGRA